MTTVQPCRLRSAALAIAALSMASLLPHSAVMARPRSTEDPKERPSNVPTEEQVAAFIEALSGATLAGTWQVTRGKGLSGALSEPKSEKYTIASVIRAGGDNYIISARIEFGEADVTIPIPVRVVWAEDTPTITITAMALPMLGNYSARVMIHEGFYAGVWYNGSKTYGGILSGQVVKTEKADKPARQKKQPTG